MIKPFYLLVDGTLTCSAIQGHSELGSNGNKGVLYIPQNTRAGATISDAFQCRIQKTQGNGLTLL